MADQKKMDEAARLIDLARTFMPGVLSNPLVYDKPCHAVDFAFKAAEEFSKRMDKMWKGAGYVG